MSTDDTWNIFSSYGPQGSTKVMRTISGASFMTRDGQSLLHCSKFGYIIQNATKKQAKIYGDGSLTIAILLSNLFRALHEYCNKNTQLNQTKTSVKIHQSINTIINTFSEISGIIIQHLISSNIWKISNNFPEMCNQLWATIITPSTNKSISTKLITILNNWLICGSEQIVMSRCQFAYQHKEKLIIVAVGNDISHSYIVSEDSMLILGRVRNRILFSTANTGHKLCSIKHWKSSTDSNDNSLLSCTVTVKSDSAWALASMQPGGMGVNMLIDMLNSLKKYQVSILLCGDEFPSDALFQAANLQIMIVDRIPIDELEWFSSQTGTTLWQHTSDYLSSILPDNTITQILPTSPVFPNSNNGVAKLSFCECSKIESLKLGGRGSEPYIKISGIVNKISELPTAPSVDHIYSGSSHVGKVSQLVLVCESPATSKILLQLIDRCLLTILTSHPSSHSSYSKLDLYLEKDDLTRLPVGLERVVVPGGGAAELAWSLFWSTVSASIIDLIKLGFSDKTSPEIIATAAIATAVSASVDISNVNKSHTSNESNEQSSNSLLEPATTLAQSLCRNVLARFDVNLENEVQVAILKLYDVADMCLLLSSAYSEPPKQLLRNAFCRTSNILKDTTSTTASNSSDFRSERMMLQWKELMMKMTLLRGGGSPSRHYDNNNININININDTKDGYHNISVNRKYDLYHKNHSQNLVPVTGNICGSSTGLIWAEDNRLGIPVYRMSFRSAWDAGCIGSAHNFLQMFFSVLEAARVYSKLGCSDTYLSVRRLGSEGRTPIVNTTTYRRYNNDNSLTMDDSSDSDSETDTILLDLES